MFGTAKSVCVCGNGFHAYKVPWAFFSGIKINGNCENSVLPLERQTSKGGLPGKC